MLCLRHTRVGLKWEEPTKLGHAASLGRGGYGMEGHPLCLEGMGFQEVVQPV